MKIAVLHPQFQSGGLDRVVVRLTKGFLNQGHEVDLLTANVSGNMYDEVAPGINRVKLKAPFRLPAIKGLVSQGSWTSLFTVPAFARYLRKHRPHVVLAASSLNGAVLGRTTSRADAALILRVSIHQSASSASDSHISARALATVRRRLFKHADAIVTNSELVAVDLQKSLSLRSEMMHVINNPSADPEIKAKSKAEVDHPWFKDPGVPVAISVGRLTAQKDMFTLIKAFAIVNSSAPCRLLILGDGEDRAKLEEASRELGISDSVDFVGFVSNPWAYMARADLFLISSKWEGSPNSLIEAMTLSVPVVSTDFAGGAGELLQQGKLGHLVPVEDPGTFASAWLDVLNNREKAQVRAAAGSEHMKLYDFDVVVQQYLDLMEDSIKLRSAK